MHSFLTLLLSFVVALSVSACGKKGSPESPCKDHGDFYPGSYPAPEPSDH